MKNLTLLSLLLLVCVALYAQPANDNFANATTLSNLSGWTSSDAAYTSLSATADGSAGSCQSVYKNVWFKFQATGTDIELKVTVGGTKGTMQYAVLTLYNSSGVPLQCHKITSATGVAFIQNTSLTSGNWYYLSVDTQANSGYPGTFTLSATSTIGYDLFSKAQTIMLSSNLYTSADAAYTTVGSTPDGSAGSCQSVLQNVWFKFQAASTDMEIKVLTGGPKGTIGFAALTLYNAAGTALQCHRTPTQTGISFIQTTTLTAGNWYYFSVDPMSSLYTGTFTLTMTDAIGYDLFAKAQVVTLSSHVFTSADAAYSTSVATPDGTAGSCQVVYQNVWFKFQAATNEAEIKIINGGSKGTISFPALTLYNSSGTALQCHRTATQYGVSFIQTTSLTAGNWYYFSVDPLNISYTGTFTMQMTDVIGNDLFQKATEVVFTSGTYNSADAAFSTLNATPDGASGTCANVFRNLWFKFQATTPEVELRALIGGTKGTMQFPIVTLYNASGTPLQCKSISSYVSMAFIQATGLTVGNWYYFSVDTQTNSGYPGSFTLFATNTIGYDLFSKAQTITLSGHSYVSADAAFTTVNATPDGTAGTCTGIYRNVWFKFQAASTDMEIKVTTGGTKGTIAVPMVMLYSSSGVPIQCNITTSGVTVAYIQTTSLTAGAWYYISVDSFNNSTYPGTFTLSMTDIIGYDLFQKAQLITLSAHNYNSANAAFTTVNATPDGTAGTCQAAVQNVWFKFQAAAAEMEIKVLTGGALGTIGYPAVTLYQASGVAIQCNRSPIQTSTAFIQTLSLTPGNWYYFSVDPLNATLSGSFSLAMTDAIGYDLRARAVQIPSDNWTSGDAAYSNVGATLDGPSGTCQTAYRNVWFSFYASTASPEIKITNGGTKGTISNPVLTLYDAGGSPIQCISLGIATGVIDMKTSGLSPGAQYYFSVDHFANVNYSGSFTVEINNGISNILDAYCFKYKYDARRRMTHKKVPGTNDWTYMVYDSRDRLVMTQDAKQRVGVGPTKYWSFTKYDQLNRPILSGIWDTSTIYTQEAMQALVDSYYASGSVPMFETYVGNVGGNVHGYSNSSYPTTTSGSGGVDLFKYLTVTYYDNYTAAASFGSDYNYVNECYGANNCLSAQDINGVTYSLPASSNPRVVGQVTATKVKVLDGGVTGGFTFLKTVNYYDEKYRLIQVYADNYRGGIDRTSNVVDFVGKVLKTKTRQTRYAVTWTEKTNVKQEGNRLIATALPAQWGGGARSMEVLPAGVDGWVEYTLSQNTPIIGLNDSNSGGTSQNDINYSFQFYNNTTLYPMQNTQFLATISGAVYGDVVRIQRIGTAIRFKKNGVDLNISGVSSSTTALFVDNSFQLPGVAATNVRASFAYRADSVTRAFSFDHAGRLKSTYHKLNNNAEVLMTQNVYNELGQLVDKNLHSNDNGTSFKQSVDYRYNIRGWLTSINNSRLSVNEMNDDINDLFGMELGYNQDVFDTNAEGLFNGNISGVKWSKGIATNGADVGYRYTYDTLNRVKSAQFKANNGAWSNSNSFSESGYRYDLNGNILSLIRNGADGSPMDNLTYTYGPPGARSNRLLRVYDAADDNKGFTELNTVVDDYTYDANGNMTADFNKPGVEVVQNGNFSNGSANWTVTDPGSRFTFSGGQLAIASGATNSTIMQSSILRANQLHALTLNFTRTSGTGTLTVDIGLTIATYTATGGTFVVICGTGTDFKITASSGFVGTITGVSMRGMTQITYNYLNLPEQVSNSGNNQLRYIYDAAGRKLNQTVFDATSPRTDYAGEYIFKNDTLQFINTEEGRIIPKGTSPEYQYHLKDHLGNVRLTFTTVNSTDQATGTLEDANLTTEQSKFLRYSDAKRVNSILFDHTNGASTGYAERLNGTSNEKFGVARSLSVMPGDTLKLEVYGKYVNSDSTTWINALPGLMANVRSHAAGVVVDGVNYATSTVSFPFAGLINTSRSTGGPKAYLNWAVFDRDYNFISAQSGYTRMSANPNEHGQDVAHEKLSSPNIIIAQPGYVYTWVSNENPTPVEVYFDDFKVTLGKGPVVQSDDYYPFGLAFNEYQRENSVPNQYLYNKGSERQDDLGLGVYQTHFRILDPALGRWWQVDPKPSYNMSVYNSMDNNPILHNDPLGDEVDIKYGGFLGIGRKTAVYGDDGKLTNKGGSAFTGKVKGYLAKATSALNTIRANGGQGGVSTLVQSKNVFTIQRKGDRNSTNPLDKANASNGMGTGATITWKPGNTNGGPDQNGSSRRPSFIGLAHELGHSLSANSGTVNSNPYRDPSFTQQFINQSLGFGSLPAKDDFNAAHFENIVRAGSNLPLREFYAMHSSGVGYMRFIAPNSNVSSQNGFDYKNPTYNQPEF